ncbi:MAG: MFS transporter [Desulfobacterales bacterium]|nr:MFS transporter [Desulfobacterales bacterium]
MTNARTPRATGIAAPAALGFGTIVLYNLAGFAFNLYDTVLYAWLPYFYSPPVDSNATAYVSIGVFGLILAAGRILDAVSDPLVGYWSDRTRSRWGRRKPYICVSGPILFLTFILVWHPPVEGVSMLNAAWLGGILLIYYWAYTGLLIPWLAVLPEMSTENSTRMKIVSVGIVFGIVGALVGGGLSGPLIQQYSPLTMALILGTLAFLAGELTLFGVRENPSLQQQELGRDGVLTALKSVFWDRQVLSFSAMIMFVQLTYQLMLMNVPYLTTLVLGQNESMASMLMGEIILLIAISTPFWYMLMKHRPKRNVMRVIILLMAFGFFASFWIGAIPFFSPFVQAVIILPLAAIPMGGMFTASLGLIADLTDYGELKTGKRTEAMYFGIYGIVRKTGWAFCSLILTSTFSLLGYSVENPLGVRVIWLICAVSCLVGFMCFRPYKIGDSKEETGRVMGL